jgi:predicted HTH transcriptional regulator
MASKIGITERSIERNIRKLQTEGKLKRIGPAKGGYWVVKEES